ncbi:GIP [Symbiodinium sp. CCMP2592]|nr:GIP [Symbiodinium sp. CCMP2592]
MVGVNTAHIRVRTLGSAEQALRPAALPSAFTQLNAETKEGMENPNEQDREVPQVMSRPNDSSARSQSGEASAQVVNGVGPPLRGRLDMDDEVAAAQGDLDLGDARTEQQPPGIPSLRPETDLPDSARDFLQGPRSSAPEAGPGHSAPSAGQKFSLRQEQLAGPMGSGGASSRMPPDPMSATARVMRSGDSVEYASVTSPVLREDVNPQILDGQDVNASLLGTNIMRRLQQLHASAPQLYGRIPEDIPPRPPSTTSSDIQLEVRRQLTEVMALHEEESRRLRAQVEALVAENYELRTNSMNDVQDRQPTSRPWLMTTGGFPGLGWLGRGLGSFIGGSPPPPPQPMDLRADPNRMFPSIAGTSHQALDLQPIPPPPPPPVPIGTSMMAQQPGSTEVPMIMPPAVMPKQLGLVPPRPSAERNPDPELGNAVGGERTAEHGIPSSNLDPMNVVLTGMAQLQGLVTELATSPKGSTKPELVKPGSVALPELPAPGPEGCLLFADWIHDSRPALSDVSDNSEVLWQLVLSESERWYKEYLMLGPMERLVSKPKPTSELQDPKWSRVSRRIESMIISAAPAAVRQELSAARVSGLLNVVSRLFCIYGPGGIAERELGLKHIQEPPVASSIQEAIDGLRRWRRWCHRMTELGGTLPDCAIRARALTKLSRQVLSQHPDISFRINLIRAELQVDLTPSDDKVEKLHGQLLSEFEAVSNRKDKDQDKDKSGSNTSQPSAKVKGVEASDATPPPPKGPKPKSAAKPSQPTPKVGQSAEGVSAGRPPCSFYTSASGCKKGMECTFEHDWNAIPAAERSQRCKSCGAKGHKAAECKAGSKEGSPKGKGKGYGKTNPNPNASSSAVTSPPPPPAGTDARQIKSMLADAALILQQAAPVAAEAQQPQSTPVNTSTQDATGGAPSGVTPGTPVTLAALQAQLDSLRSMTRDFGVRTVTTAERELSERIEAVALLDSGATHAVIPYNPSLQDLDSVPVTLAGDARDQWWKTKGGTLVVPPQGQPANSKELQMILPFGALVQTLGCKVSWSKRSGLTVIHPRLGRLKTGISKNTCPFVQEEQALALIAELEERRLAQFEEEVQTLHCHLESLEKPLDPTEALRIFAMSGSRQDALRAVLAQPYFSDAREDLRSRLAEQLPGFDEESGKEVLKGLPLNRASRRELLSSRRWLVHLCSGTPERNDPLREWAQERGVKLLQVDIQGKGGRGWDLGQSNGVWKALLWAAASGRVVGILSSPPPIRDEVSLALNLQPMFLWSLASVTKGTGIPYLFEHALMQDKVPEHFALWSGGRCERIGSKVDSGLKVITNLDLGFVEDLEFEGRKWSKGLKRVIAQALSGRPRVQAVEALDQAITKGLAAIKPCVSKDVCQSEDEDEEGERLNRMFEQESQFSSSDEEEILPNLDEGQAGTQGASQDPRVNEVKEMSQASLDGWRRHLMNGHTPYRRDCKHCVEGAGLGVFHNKVKHPRSFSLSIDLFGPVPRPEAGRDETCVTGKCTMRYGLVGAFRVPRKVLGSAPGVDGVGDLFSPKGPNQAPLPADVDREEYQPSEPGEELFPELFDVPIEPMVEEALEPIEVKGVAPEEESESLLKDDEGLPDDDEGLKALVSELQEPVEQVVLRFFLPLKTKTGPEVTEAVQQMILGISKDYPVKSLHHDPGTEFSTTVLSRWLADKGIRVQHSLPTDKRGNGLAERTVGWVKERIRTLLGATSMPIHWWPLAARWAVHKHNSILLGLAPPPAFGQKVLHRVKRPADGAKQLMERWVEAFYGAPHRTVQGGHVLVTTAGNLVASRGFKSEVIDPTQLAGLGLPLLQEDDLPPEPLVEPSGDQAPVAVAPSKRLRRKSRVEFVECDESLDLESLARGYLLEDDVSDSAFRTIAEQLQSQERSSGDRRGNFEGKFVLGAFCHGGQRGVTTLGKRLPTVTSFLNHFLRRRLLREDEMGVPGWSSIMVMHASEISKHKDVRNEWHSLNYVLCVPGGYDLHVENLKRSSGSEEAQADSVHSLTHGVVSFDARCPHSVHKRPDWFIVGYTPLGTYNTDESEVSSHGTSVPDLEPIPGMQSQGQAFGEGGVSQVSLEEDEQQDSFTPYVGWDPSQGEGHNYPAQNLEETDLQQFLEDRGVGSSLRRLLALGVEQASDLAFLFREDLIEYGIPPPDAVRIMQGVHPSGTVRPDNPNLTSLTSGEVRLIDRQHRQLPWVIQNRTLLQKQPVVPVAGLGVKDPTREEDDAYDWIVSEERKRNEERWIDYTQVQGAQSSSSDGPPPLCAESVVFPAAQVNLLAEQQLGEQGGCHEVVLPDYESYAEFAMAMQAVWDEDEVISGLEDDDEVPQVTGMMESVHPPLCAESVVFPAAQVQIPLGDYSSVPPVGSGPDVYCSVPPVGSGLGGYRVDSTRGRSSWPQISRRRYTMQRANSEPAPAVRTLRTEDPVKEMEPTSSSSAAQVPRRIRVPTQARVSLLDVWEDSSPDSEHLTRNKEMSEFPEVKRVDEDFFTPGIEELLKGLSAPLKVVHNVSPAEIKKHMMDWRPSAVEEVRALEEMKGIRRLRGNEAVRAAAEPGIQILPAKGVWTVKPGKANQLYRRKCRIVGCGNYEKRNPDHELFAGGVPADVLRACLIHASDRDLQAWITDIKNAFLLAPIPSEEGARILLRPPKVLEEMGITTPGELWEVTRAIYGLRQSPRWWSIHRDSVLTEATWYGPRGRTKLQQSSVEANLWSMVTEDGHTVGHLIVYVDDLMLLANPGDAEGLFEWIKGRWECTPLQKASVDEPITFLGVEIQEEVNSAGRKGFCLKQGGYIDELTRIYNTPTVNRAAPLPKEWVRELPEPDEPLDPTVLRQAQKITGELLWIAQRSRPDVAHEVGLMSSWVSRAPTLVHKLGMRVLEFLKSTRDLTLSMTPVPGAPSGVVVYTDASFAPYGGHSISGILIQYKGRNILWKAKKQSIVCLSTAESELVAACEGVVLGQSTEALMKELSPELQMMQLLVDNLAAIVISEGGGTREEARIAAFRTEDDEVPPQPFVHVQIEAPRFTALFLAEVIIRMHHLGWDYATDPWNIFDYSLVVFSWTDMLVAVTEVESGGLRLAASLRLFRLLRVVRSIRGVKILSGLWLVIQGLLDSYKTVLWIAFAMAIFIFCFGAALCVLGGQDRFAFEYWYLQPMYLGSVLRAMFTTLQVATFDDWADSVARPLFRVAPMAGPAVFLLIFARASVRESAV